MRFVVLLFGILAVLLTGFVGAFFVNDGLDELLAFVPADQKELAQSVIVSPLDTPHADTGMFMLLSAAFGMFGVILAFGRCGWQGALLIIVPVLTTAIMNPFTLVFSGLQVFVGLLAFLVFPLPLESPKDNRNDDDEAEPQSKPKAKAKRNDEDDEEEERPSKSKPKAKSKRQDEDDE